MKNKNKRNSVVNENQTFNIGASGGSDGKESACNGETWVRSLDWEDPLEKEMATHSRIVAWKVSWTEEPGGL